MEDAKEKKYKEKKGIPQGNTIVVVGDPGTGKTTFLLSFFRYALLRHGRIFLSEEISGTSSLLNDPHMRLNGLFRPSTTQGNDQKLLRIFISLESSFDRMLANHNKLLDINKGEGHFVFVDASGLLSGRLEDKLRYPRFNNGGETDKEDDNWDRFEFSLKACDEKNSGNRYLHWEDTDSTGKTKSKRIDQLNSNDKPFEMIRMKPFLFVLGTPSVPDVRLRIRIFKDLLAALFATLGSSFVPLLTIDSLSALITPFSGGEQSADVPNSPTLPSTRRLNMLNLIRWLEERRATTFMSCEAKRTDQATLRGQPLFLGEEERYLASGVIQLDYHRYRSGDIVRFLRILKMRGAAHDMRAYAYDLCTDGIEWLELLFGEAGQGDNYA